MSCMGFIECVCVTFPIWCTKSRIAGEAVLCGSCRRFLWSALRVVYILYILVVSGVIRLFSHA
jgi:hypothetical protein